MGKIHLSVHRREVRCPRLTTAAHAAIRHSPLTLHGFHLRRLAISTPSFVPLCQSDLTPVGSWAKALMGTQRVTLHSSGGWSGWCLPSPSV